MFYAGEIDEWISYNKILATRIVEVIGTSASAEYKGKSFLIKHYYITITCGLLHCITTQIYVKHIDGWTVQADPPLSSIRNNHSQLITRFTLATTAEDIQNQVQIHLSRTTIAPPLCLPPSPCPTLAPPTNNLTTM